MKIAGLLVLIAASVCQADLTVTVNDVAVLVGEDAVIPCTYESANENIPKITWSLKRNDGSTQRLYVYDEGDSSQTYADAGAPSRTPALAVNEEGSLVMAQTTINDNTDYATLTCEVSLGSDGVQSADAMFVAALLPEEAATTSISEYDAGKTGFDVTDTSTNLGFCRSSKSYPAAKITFYKNGKPLPVTGDLADLAGIGFTDDVLTTTSEDGISMITNKDLMKIVEITDHQADFTCNVKTIYGDRVFERNYTMPKFNVNYQTTMASFDSPPPDAYLGETITLRCTADGFPAPTISIDDQPGAELMVNVTKQVDGKDYICKAYNNEMQKDTPLTSDPYTMDVLSLSQPVLAGIDGSSVDYGLGDAISIQCSSDGNPAPSIAWYKGDEMISKSGTLSFSSASLGNSGDYTCRGISDYAKLNKSTPLRVEVKGISLVGEEEMSVPGKKDDEVTLECSVNANPAPTFTWSGDEQGTDVTTDGYLYTNQLVVGPLSPEISKKEYTCTATAEDGTVITKKFTLPEIVNDIEPVVTKAPKDDDTDKEIAAGSSSTAIIIVILVLILIVAVVLAVLYNKGIICKKSEEKGDESAEGDIEGGMNNDDDPEAGNGKAAQPADDNDQPASNNPEEEKLMARGEED